MKKLLLFIALIIFGLGLNAQGTRSVLIEHFTGVYNGYCPNGHMVANEIAKSNPGKVFPINIHAGPYASTTYPNMNTADGTAIFNAFNVHLFPSGNINRNSPSTIGRYEWSENTDTQLSQLAEVNIGGYVDINPITRIAEISVNLSYSSNSASSTNYLTIMMLQDSIMGYQSNASSNPEQYVNGQYCHMHVLRDVVTSTWGDAVSPTTAGTKITKTYTYEIPEMIGSPNGIEVDLDNIYFLAFVTEKYQGIPTCPVLNVEKLEKKMPNYKDYLDSSFGTDGVFVFHPSKVDAFGYFDHVYKVLVQEDGKILTIGESCTDKYNSAIYISRHNVDGTLDETYGEGGYVFLKVSELIYKNCPKDAVLGEDGMLYIAGCTYNNGLNAGFILCLDENGFENEDFGEGGWVVTEQDQYGLIYEGIDIDKKGRILVAGYYNDEIIVRRFTKKGTLDVTFGNNGTVSLELDADPAAHSYAFDIKALDNGKIILCGYKRLGSADEGLFIWSHLIRLKSNGTLDETFAENGVLYLYAGEYAEFALSLAVQPDGKYLVAGHNELYSNTPGMPRYESFITRVNTNGTIDTTFATNGFAKFEPFQGDGCINNCCSILAAPDGQIFGTIYSRNIATESYRGYVYNLDPNGQPNESFAGSGIVPLPKVYEEQEEINTYSIALNIIDDKLVVAGYAAYDDPAVSGPGDYTKIYLQCVNVDVKAVTTPKNLVAIPESDSSISLIWDVVEDAFSYNVYNGENIVANVTTNSYDVEKLDYNTDYCFTVTAVRNETETEKSESACARTFDLSITTPTNLVAEATSTSSISLTWNAVENALSYNIYNGVNKIANVTTTSYVVNNLNYYTDYSFTVTAVRNETETEKSEPSCAKTFDLPIITPTNLVAEATSTSSISLTWNAEENALSYNVYQGEEIIANVTTNSYEVDNLNYYTDYCFTVTAVRNETETENSEPSCAKTFDLPITTPNNLVAEATGTSSISLTWNAVENALSYNIYNGVNKVANVTTTSYVVDNLNYYTDYCFTVSAVRNETETDKSEEACSKTFDLSITTPENLIAEALSFSSISLTWNAVENALSYNVYNGGIMIANVTGNSYIVNDLNYDTDYCYTVSAVRNETETDKSEEACAKTLLPITTPENVIAEATGVSTISLKWNAVENALSYNVYSGENKIANVIENTYIVNELNYYTDYCFTVTAVRNETETEKSESACAKTFDLPIATPENVNAEATSISSISLTWDVVENALSYNVYCGENLIANVTENSYVVNNLNYYTDYCYTVTALRNETESDKSEEVCAKTMDLSITKPEEVVATPTSTSSIIITWEMVENALSYNLYRDNELVKNLKNTNYTDTGLEYDTEYCYVVTAVRNETESEKSEKVCVKTLGEGVNEISLTVNVYPIPVTDKLFIDTETYIEEICIYTLSGVMVYKEVDFNNKSVDVSEYNSGVYVIMIKSNDKVVMKRFIKN